MLVQLPNRFVTGEIADPVKLNENFAYIQAVVNGGLDAENLSRTYRMAVGAIKNTYTPTCFELVFDDAAGVGTANAQRVQLGQTTGAAASATTAHFSHLSINAVTSTGRVRPINVSTDDVVFAAYRGATEIWRNRYDSRVPAGTYTWSEGQQVGNPTVHMGFTNADDLLVAPINDHTGLATLFIVRVWVYFPQATIAAATALATESLTRNLLPRELA